MSVIKDNENLYTLDKDKNPGTASRKMAAIFAADVVGYSKLMATNEKLTLFRLKETRKFTDKVITDLNGNIFSTAGDSIMAEFASPVDAVEAAIEIQKEMKIRSEKITDNVRIDWRIGVNLGDIMVQDNNLYGDNVNIAARLEAAASPGEICISEKVFLEVDNKVSAKFFSTGAKKLKNIAQKVKTFSTKFEASEEDNVRNLFNIKRLSVLISATLAVLAVIYVSYTNFIKKDKIEYTENSKSVLENFRSSQLNEQQNDSANINTGKLVIALMDFHNQSSGLANSNIENLNETVSNTLLSKEELAVVRAPKGSENLNPPEVMLIATESNAAFVINGIVFSENNKNGLSLKIYEAKRGSIIVNKKIIIEKDGDFVNLKKFMTSFAKDISKK